MTDYIPARVNDDRIKFREIPAEVLSALPRHSVIIVAGEDETGLPQRVPLWRDGSIPGRSPEWWGPGVWVTSKSAAEYPCAIVYVAPPEVSDEW